MDTKDLTSSSLRSADARAYLYTMFRILFDAPMTANAARLLLDPQTTEALAVATGSGEASNAFEASEAYAAIKAVACGEKSALDKMEGEFNRAFVGPTTLVAPPWESVWVNEDRSLLQESTLDVRRAYAEAGFTVADKGATIDDHVAVECEFLARVYQQGIQALEEGNEGAARKSLDRAASFEHEHLSRMTTPLARALENRCPVYAAIARLLDRMATTHPAP